jgi:hypothetical protein
MLLSFCWRPPTCHSALADSDTRPTLVPQEANARLLLSPLYEAVRETPALNVPSAGCAQEAVRLCWSR